MSDVASGSVTATLRLTSPGAKAVLSVFLLVHFTIMIATLDRVTTPLLSLIAFAVLVVGALLLTTPAPEPLPLPRTAATVLVVIITTALVDWNLAPTGPLGYESWPFGANAMLLLVLSLRGRTTIAWVGFGLMVVVTLWWSIDIGRGPGVVVDYLPVQAGTLLVGSLFALGLRRTGRRIAELHATQAGLAAAEAAAVASAAEQVRQSDYLELVARPAIDRIAEPAGYSLEERAQWLQLEAAIRDSLRAPALMVPEVVAAATLARSRGVSVTLLDDSTDAPHSQEQTDAAVTAITAALEQCGSGDFTARILPAGRPYLATIVVESIDETLIVNVER